MKILSLLGILTATNAFAGASNIELDCASRSGDTRVVASVPGDFAEHEVSFTIAGFTISWFDTAARGKNSAVTVLGKARGGDLRFGIFSTDHSKRFFVLTQIEGGRIDRTPNGEKGTLRAKVVGVDPRDPDKESPETEVSCSYRFEI